MNKGSGGGDEEKNGWDTEEAGQDWEVEEVATLRVESTEAVEACLWSPWLDTRGMIREASYNMQDAR